MDAIHSNHVFNYRRHWCLRCPGPYHGSRLLLPEDVCDFATGGRRENDGTFYRYIAAVHLSQRQLRAREHGQPLSGWSGLCDVTTDGRRQSME